MNACFDCTECCSKALNVRVICEVAVTICTEGEGPTTRIGVCVTQLWLRRFCPVVPPSWGKRGTPLRMGSEEESHDWAFHSYTTSPSQSDMGEVTP